MSDLCRALSDEFTRAARTKGDAYSRAGRVTVTRGGADALEAVVEGSRPYAVEFVAEQHDGEVVVSAWCDCPYVDERMDPCKHMWAALRTAENAGHLADADAGRGRVHMEIVPPDDAETSASFSQPRKDVAAYGSRRSLTATARPDVSDRMHRDWAARREASVKPAARPAPGPAARPDRGAILLSQLEAHVREREATPARTFRYAAGELIYVFVPPAAHAPRPHVLLHVMSRARKKNGDWGLPRPVTLSASDITAAPEADRRILAPLAGAVRAAAVPYAYYDPAMDASFSLHGPLAGDLVPAIAATGRAFLKITRPVPGANGSRTGYFYAPPPTETVWLPLAWDDGGSWQFVASATPAARGWSLHGALVRSDAELALAKIVAIDESFVWTQASVARADAAASLPLIRQLINGPIPIAAADAPRLGLALAGLGVAADRLPDALRIVSVDVAPRPTLRLSPAPTGAQPDRLDAALSFDYDGSIVPAGSAPTFFDEPRRRVIARRLAEETAAAERLPALGCAPTWDAYERRLRYYVRARPLGALVSALLDEGWRVEGTTGAYRRPGAIRMSVVSGIDWFDLDATVTFDDDATAPLGDVLAAIARREPTVRLGDGSIGLLAEDWLRRYLPIAAAGEPVDGRLRFRPSQAALLDALVAEAASHATVDLDAGFRRACEELARTGCVEPADPPASFMGTLRDYQREGLGWLQFLDRAGFGGCLADDMGLGKTVMVLAMLEARRPASGRADGPSLAVVPRSLIHNWLAEARRFTPEMKVLDFSTSDRAADAAFDDADLVLITYGTLRRDILRLKDESFDYVILDEAQAIKNAGTAGAKAARVLRARRRLALTGTPIENHLGELWSLFEFLNPGVLGRSTTFERAASLAPDEETIARLARGLRPFILRRTKQQVARELPARTEQTITCELSKPERTFYEKLRRHYRESVLARVDRDGLPRAQMHILEALLRLRQAACHPGLVDRTRTNDSSAKLDVLLARLEEIAGEGHKALVFSQFTSLLALVRRQLDARGVVYEYLDGRTRDRGRHVARFQDDPACPLFLVSLKAGGIGLNLTAAEYVFLLDPWWNPAVEAQAIDRTHRIGQTREVFAYRLVAGGTIEEKILELQQKKRALADAILSAGGASLRHLDRRDLEALLS